MLAELQASLPAGMVIETDLFRQADFIAVAVANVEAALRDGTVLVVLIVFAFLASLGATHEIQGSIVFATLIILVFLPLFVLSGVRPNAGPRCPERSA